MESKVYFIQCGLTNAVKVGVSCDPQKRLAQLQTACPGKLSLVATMPGGQAKEAEIHKHYENDRLRGEWFDIAEFEIDHILELHCQNGNAAVEQLRLCGQPRPELCYLASMATGWSVEIWTHFVPGLEHAEHYRAMPSPGDMFGEIIEFYYWHERNARLLFSSPEAACADLVRSWELWKRRERDGWSHPALRPPGPEESLMTTDAR